MSEFGNNIRRIARTEELEKKIQEASDKIKHLDKAVIEARRGIAYYDPSSNSAGRTDSGTPGDTTANSTYPNATTGGQSLTQGGQISDTSRDGDDLLSGADRPKVGEKAGTIELVDCDTGEELNIDFSNPNGEGEGIFKPPDDWDSSDSPPVDPSFTLGQTWVAYGATFPSSPLIEQTFTSLVTSMESDSGLTAYAFSGGVISSLTPVRGTDILMGAAGKNIGETGGTVVGYDSNLTANNFATGYGPRTCGTVSGDTVVCNLDPPLQTEWPEDKVSILAYSAERGGFFSSQYDNNISNTWRRRLNENQTGFKKLELCTKTGQEVTVEASQDGGFFVYARDAFGDPDTAVAPIQHYNTKGEFIDTISEDQYNFFEG